MKRKLCIVVAIILCLTVGLFIVSFLFKDTHIIRIDDNTLRYNGYEYKRLGDDEHYFDLYELNTKTVYITEKGVLSLFSRLFHEDWKGMSHTFMTENEYFIGKGFDAYCREDIYSELEELTNDIDYDLCVYTYGEGNVYTLTDEEFNTVKKLLSEEEFIPSYELSYLPSVEHTIDLGLYDKQTQTGTGYERLCILEDGYCFTRLEGGNTEYCMVPDEYRKSFDGVTSVIK